MDQKPDLKKIWGDLDWNGATIAVLHSEIRKRLKETDINQIGKRVVPRDMTVQCEEEYTLMDMLIEKRLSAKNQNPKHWEALMGLLRSMGAKPACALPKTETPAQKILMELSKVETKRKLLLSELKKIRQK